MRLDVSHILVIYDISDDRRRFELADRLRLLGMIRVQKSAFLSEFKPSIISEVKRVSVKTIDLETDNVQIYPLTPASYRMRISIGRVVANDGKMPEGGVLIV